MNSDDWAHGLIKWGKREYLECLVQGALYLNTPEYYRVNAGKFFGDKSESCTNSYRAGRDETPPMLLGGDGVQLSALHLTAMTVYGVTSPSFYLHCWSMVSAWRNTAELNDLAADLQRQREELGPCFVALRARDIETLLARIQTVEPDAWCSAVKYSPDPNSQGCACKYPQVSWQREFRFLVGECEEKETNARELQIGDLSDLLLFDGRLDLLNDRTKVSIDADRVNVID